MEDGEKGIAHTYGYNAINQLLREEVHSLADWDSISKIRREYEFLLHGEGYLSQRYIYDKRGNLLRESQNEKELQGYGYDAPNRMERAWNNEGEEAVYQYNGMGHRVEKILISSKKSTSWT